MLINYDKSKMRQTGIPTLMMLLRDVVYDDSVNAQIYMDEKAHRKLLDRYNITDPVLRDALLQAAKYSNEWADRYNDSGGRDDENSREIYTQNMQTIMVFLAKEWHGTVFSVVW